MLVIDNQAVSQIYSSICSTYQLMQIKTISYYYLRNHWSILLARKGNKTPFHFCYEQFKKCKLKFTRTFAIFQKCDCLKVYDQIYLSSFE